MVKDFKFSIIIAVYNSEDYLEETIESVLCQDIGFEDNIQLILVNDGSTDASLEIAKNYEKLFPENIIVLSKENGGPASARNLGLNYCSGDVINFLDGDDKFSENTLSSVYDFFKNNDDIDIVSIPLVFFGRIEGDHYLNYKYAEERVVNLEIDYQYPQMSGASSFIKSAAIKDKKFNEVLINGEDVRLINEILLDKKKIGFINSTKYLYRKRLDSSSFMDNPFLSKKAYTEKIKLCYKHLIDYSLSKYEEVPKFIQYAIILDLHWIVLNKNFENLIQTSDEISEFWESFDDVLSYIDEEVILKHKTLNKDIKNLFITLKNKDFHTEIGKGKRISLKSNNHTINNLHNLKVVLDIVEIKNGFLNISCKFVSNCEDEYLDFELIKYCSGKKEVFKPKYLEYFDRKTHRYLSIDWKFFKSFDFKIPLDDEPFSLLINLIYDKKGVHIERMAKLGFSKYSDLSNFSTYYVKDSKIIFYHNNKIFIYPYSYFRMIKRELKDLKHILSKKPSHYKTALFYRVVHLLLYPFMKNQRIWLFEDRLTVADDNAEHLFKYSLKQSDEIKSYFVIEKECEDYIRLSKNFKNVIGFKSFKHKFLYLFAEKIISSHVDHIVLNPFYDKRLSLYNGIITIQQCFLQHGITKDNMSYWIRKYNMNLFLFLVTSQLEYNSLFEEEYNYDVDVVQMLGFPRYDTLISNNLKKQILFMPTWRNYARSREDFLNSKHFIRINSLINNKRLLNFLKENGYELVFKPHFEIFEHIDLFNIPNEINVSSDESYQKLFNESSMMITDFSSVAFDFAYLKKPIIYYQEEKDYHNNSSYFNYESMGFGEVIKSEDDLVDKIIEYIENGCKMKEEYIGRVNEFFTFTDKNNCERVYNWLLNNR